MNNKIERTLVDEFCSTAESLACEDLNSFMDQFAEHTTSDVFNEVERNLILLRLADNPLILAGKPEFKKMLSKHERKTKSQDRQGVKGGYGIYQLRDDGVYRLTENTDVRICDRLEVLAVTRTSTNSEWGRLLEWKDLDGKLHRWSMPASLTAGDIVNVASALLAEGLKILHGSNKFVVDYVMSVPVEQRMISTNKPGWTNTAFVTPDVTYGSDEYVFQSDAVITPTLGQKGALEGWKNAVSLKAVGNSRLMLGLCCAFAGSLLDESGVGSGGFHLWGKSSDGKSTVQKVASSVWGKPDDYMLTWRTTDNGLESTASAHNDGLLVLDELKQMEGKGQQVGKAVYMLANGQGKTRMTKTLSTREPMKWRLIFLSSGELTLSERINEDGGKTFAGHEVRLVDIPSDAGAGFGAFEALHNAPSARVFADDLTRSVQESYGVAGDAWLNFLTSNSNWRDLLAEKLEKTISELAKDKSQQVGRVARRFALLACAGEFATKAGVTGWKAGDAYKAIQRCFEDWLSEFGNGNRDDLRILEAVKKFLESQGSRFDNDSVFGSQGRIANLVGFHVFGNKEDNLSSKVPQNDHEVWVLASQMTELAKGYAANQIKQALFDAGWVESTTSKNKRFAGSQYRAYKVTVPDRQGREEKQEPDILDDLFG